MKYSLSISNFLEEISSLLHSTFSLSFFALITEDSFLISPCYSLELCIKMGISFLFSFVFLFSSFQRYLLGLLGQPFCFFAFLFLGSSWSSWSLSPVQCHKPSAIVFQALCLSNLITWIYVSLPLYNHEGFDLGHTWMVSWLSLLSSI